MYIQYRSDARYKARVIHAFARGGKRTCTLRQIHVYTYVYTHVVYTRRQTPLHEKAIYAFALYMYLASDLCCTYMYIIHTCRKKRKHRNQNYRYMGYIPPIFLDIHVGIRTS